MLKMKTPLLVVGAILFISSFFVGCGEKKNIDPDLEQAGMVIKRILSPENLSNSMFAVAYPECKPSQFAGYMISGFASAEMPPRESIANEEEKEQSRIMRMPLWPDSVSIAAERPDPREGKQLVLKYNDSTGVLIVEYYENPVSEPVGTSEFAVPKVVASTMAKLTYGSYIDLGGRQ